MKPNRKRSDATRRPEAEKAFLAGMLELLQDDVNRCRKAIALVEPSALTVEAGPELLTAIIEASALDAPTMADVLRIARERGGDDAADERSLLADLASASVGSPGGYALGVERNAREIMKAATRRRTIEAATLVADVAADPQAKPADIEAAAAAVAQASTSAPAERVEWQPFPVELLPEPVCSFVRQVWASLDRSADPACAALPLLASIAAAIGNRRRIEIRPGWTEPSVLWCAIVAESGSKKSPAADKSLSFVRDRQTAAFEAHKIAVAEWEEERRNYEASRRSKAADAEPPSPKPIATRFIVNDITVESLALFRAMRNVQASAERTQETLLPLAASSTAPCCVLSCDRERLNGTPRASRRQLFNHHQPQSTVSIGDDCDAHYLVFPGPPLRSSGGR